MEYAQLNEAWDEALQITTHGNIEWSPNHFCPASALTPEEAVLFRVVPLQVTEPPEHDQFTQSVVRDGCELADGQWRYKWRVDDLTPEQSAAVRFQKDRTRYEKRAAVKDHLLAYMAADNMSRVRAGVWAVSDLLGLLADPAVAAANQFMSTLSFELAAQAISTAETPLLTPEIRADWVGRLQAHFYLEG